MSKSMLALTVILFCLFAAALDHRLIAARISDASLDGIWGGQPNNKCRRTRTDCPDNVFGIACQAGGGVPGYDCAKCQQIVTTWYDCAPTQNPNRECYDSYPGGNPYCGRVYAGNRVGGLCNNPDVCTDPTEISCGLQRPDIAAGYTNCP